MKFLVLVSSFVLCVAAIPGYAPYSGAYEALYHGPPAPLGHDGRVVDTPEVAHAKAAHLAAHAVAAAKASPLDYSDGSFDGSYGGSYTGLVQTAYHGPPAPLGHDGQVIDTPEVAHAKAAHLAAHAEQLSKAATLSYVADPYAKQYW